MSIAYHRTPAAKLGLNRYYTLTFMAVMAALAFLVRYQFVVDHSADAGDWFVYAEVARNILQGCGVAITSPVTGKCVANFGGNQLPLFPAFVAGIWYLFGQSNVAIRLAETCFAVLATLWLSYAIFRLTRNYTTTALTSAVLAISPVQAFWAGCLLPETLALASIEWVLAELLLSFAARRLRVIPLSIALAVAMWARLDGILLLVPASLTALLILGPKRGIRAALLVGILTGIPSAAWAVRNFVVGIDPFPSPFVDTYGTRGPVGYLDWTNTWITTEMQRQGAVWPVGMEDYSKIKIPPSAYASAAERAHVQTLLAKLPALPGRAFPLDIDAAFRHLAQVKASQQGIGQIIVLNLKRTLQLLRLWWWAPKYYRISIVLLFTLALVIGMAFREPSVGFLSKISISYIVIRLAFFVLTVNIEARYMAELAPFMECTAAAGLGWLLTARPLRPAYRAAE